MAGDSGQWLRRLADCLDAVERGQIGSACPVVDHEIAGSAAAGDADDLAVWLVCRTKAERRLFADTEQARFTSALKQRMLAGGFSEAAVASLTVRATSREEVAAAGGRFAALR
ncbi:hypothetical protein [Oleiharenicola sp. Vm1]|uniref:hypothetical protein n=1 Tax=Oleiharenicola sp. Vm1 TaxID=3398393 RepID=UPI0039F5EF9B